MTMMYGSYLSTPSRCREYLFPVMTRWEDFLCVKYSTESSWDVKNTPVNSLTPERYGNNCKCITFKLIRYISSLGHSLRKYFMFNAKKTFWWYDNIGSVNRLEPLGNMSLHKPMNRLCCTCPCGRRTSPQIATAHSSLRILKNMWW